MHRLVAILEIAFTAPATSNFGQKSPAKGFQEHWPLGSLPVSGLS
jgi:hypothetical protein